MNLPGKLDRIEKYTVRIRFAEDLATDVKVWVAPDAESKATDRRGRQGEGRRAAAAEQFRERAEINSLNDDAVYLPQRHCVIAGAKLAPGSEANHCFGPAVFL